MEKTKKALAEALEQIEKLKNKETGKPAAQPKEKTIKDGHEYVDLGLPSGLKWATCNIGARAPEASCDYFAWGEIKTKKSFSESGSLTYGKKKYSIEIAGNSQLDAARANWGGSWRMPTKGEMEELCKYCTWEWTAQNGIKGYNVKGLNGNSIFLPAADDRRGSSLGSAGSLGFYWSSTPGESFTATAYALFFNSGSHSMKDYYREYGRCIRPVSE